MYFLLYYRKGGLKLVSDDAKRGGRGYNCRLTLERPIALALLVGRASICTQASL